MYENEEFFLCFILFYFIFFIYLFISFFFGHISLPPHASPSQVLYIPSNIFHLPGLEVKMFVLLVNLKLLTIANPFLLNINEHENFSAKKIWKCQLQVVFFSYLLAKKNAQLSWYEKKFYNLGAWHSSKP